jgi:hypothetical protein
VKQIENTSDFGLHVRKGSRSEEPENFSKSILSIKLKRNHSDQAGSQTYAIA